MGDSCREGDRPEEAGDGRGQRRIIRELGHQWRRVKWSRNVT